MAETKRTAPEKPDGDLLAGEAFRNSMLFRVDSVDASGAPLWHGWVIMDAFLAGIEYARKEALQNSTQD